MRCLKRRCSGVMTLFFIDIEGPNDDGRFSVEMAWVCGFCGLKWHQKFPFGMLCVWDDELVSIGVQMRKFVCDADKLKQQDEAVKAYYRQMFFGVPVGFLQTWEDELL